MKSQVFLCVGIVLIISPLVISEGQWGYTGKAGPKYWHEQFKKCAGKKQSPIDIKAEESMYDPDLKNFAIWYDPPRPDSNMTVKNNGHTLQVDLEGDFYVSNGGLKHVYKAAQFHFHWGGQVHHGSEHLIEGKASPIEGSLTTPHCHESVIWTVFQQTQTISVAQLNQFRTLLQFGHRHHKDSAAPKVEVAKSGDDSGDQSRRRRSASRRHRHLSKIERDVLVELGIKGNHEEEAYLKQATERQMYAEMGMMSDQPADPSANQVDKKDAPGDHKEEEGELHQPVIINNYRPVQPLHGRVVYRSFKLREPGVATARSDKQRVSYTTVNGEEEKPPCDGAAGVWASLLVLLASLLTTVFLVL
ncbi:carbonic anhydrase [Elysia marginata]|uniref:carbonic anhydrase n=1 Tax=Elysia marginata TaxID=1093978 RepID=A0AAV4J2B1_9GAST|nr:carbonic anhydrase [Elysia marginata]